MEDEMDELMLPGFRFHPTDEELVGFYLRRKIQHKPLSIELIKQLDIYKYDPWDLQKLAATGDKEWYFYCPRDRKYRNSPRPNRVTEAGFWKATGTDRPIYSSQGSKVCIGLKKSLVFYKGRAAKGIKTDWMMHEFRLPSPSDSLSANRCLDKNIPANEAWAICRIFKKANSSAQKAITHSWVPPVFNANTISSHHILNPNFSNLSEDSNQLTSPSSSQLFAFHNDAHHSSQLANFFSPKPLCPLSQPSTNHSNSGHQETLNNPTLLSSPTVTSEPKCAINDASSLLLDMSNSVLGDSRRGSSDSTVGGFGPLHDQHDYGFSMSNFQENHGQGSNAVFVKGQDLVQIDDPMLRPVMGLHYGLGDVWKWSSLLLDSSPCPVAEFPTGFSTNNYYT